MSLIVVKAAYDADAGVWFVESSDLPGLNVEAATVEKLKEQIPLAVADLLEAAANTAIDFDVPIDRRPRQRARPPRDRGVRGYGHLVRKKLTEGGCAFLRHGRGDHDVWRTPHADKPFTVPVDIDSRHTATRC